MENKLISVLGIFDSLSNLEAAINNLETNVTDYSNICREIQSKVNSVKAYDNQIVNKIYIPGTEYNDFRSTYRVTRVSLEIATELEAIDNLVLNNLEDLTDDITSLKNEVVNANLIAQTKERAIKELNGFLESADQQTREDIVNEIAKYNAADEYTAQKITAGNGQGISEENKKWWLDAPLVASYDEKTGSILFSQEDENGNMVGMSWVSAANVGFVVKDSYEKKERRENLQNYVSAVSNSDAIKATKDNEKEEKIKSFVTSAAAVVTGGLNSFANNFPSKLEEYEKDSYEKKERRENLQNYVSAVANSDAIKATVTSAGTVVTGALGSTASSKDNYLIQKAQQTEKAQKIGFLDKDGNVKHGATSYYLDDDDSNKYTINFDSDERADNLYLVKGDINSNTYTNYFKDRTDGRLETTHNSDGTYVQKYDGEYEFNYDGGTEYKGEYLVFDNTDSDNIATTAVPLAKFDRQTEQWIEYSETEKKEMIEKVTNYYSEIRELSSNYSDKFKQEVAENISTQTLVEVENNTFAGITSWGSNGSGVVMDTEGELSDWNVNAYTHELAHVIDQNQNYKYSNDPTFQDVCDQVYEKYYDENAGKYSGYNVYTVFKDGKVYPRECWGRMVEGYFGTGKGHFSSDDLKSMEVTVDGIDTNVYEYLSTKLE